MTSIAQASLRARRWERARPPSRYGFRRRRRRESMSRRGASREGRKLGEGGWPVPPRRCFSHQRMAHVCVQHQRRDIHCESATGRIRRGAPGAQPQELRQESASAEGAIHAQKEFLRNQSRGCSIETRLQRVVMGTAIGAWSVAPRLERERAPHQVRLRTNPSCVLRQRRDPIASLGQRPRNHGPPQKGQR